MPKVEGGPWAERMTGPQISKKVFEFQSLIIDAQSRSPFCTPEKFHSLRGLEFSGNDYTKLELLVDGTNYSIGKTIESDQSVEGGLYFATRVLIVEANPIDSIADSNTGFVLYSTVDFFGVPGAGRPSAYKAGRGLFFSASNGFEIELSMASPNSDAINQIRKYLPESLGGQIEVNPPDDSSRVNEFKKVFRDERWESGPIPRPRQD